LRPARNERRHGPRADQYAGFDSCFCVEVVLVGVVVGVCFEELLFEFPPPHPATTRVLATTANSVSMAVSEVVLMGRAPVVARGLGI
jgi:hypothetical protein